MSSSKPDSRRVYSRMHIEEEEEEEEQGKEQEQEDEGASQSKNSMQEEGDDERTEVTESIPETKISERSVDNIFGKENSPTPPLSLFSLPSTEINITCWGVWNSSRRETTRTQLNQPMFVMGDAVSVKNTRVVQSSSQRLFVDTTKFIVTGGERTLSGSFMYSLTPLHQSLKYNSVLMMKDQMELSNATVLQDCTVTEEGMEKEREAIVMGTFSMDFYFLGDVPDPLHPSHLISKKDVYLMTTETYEIWMFLLYSKVIPVLWAVINRQAIETAHCKEYRARRINNQLQNYPHYSKLSNIHCLTRFSVRFYIILPRSIPEPATLFHFLRYFQSRATSTFKHLSLTQLVDRKVTRLSLYHEINPFLPASSPSSQQSSQYCFWNLHSAIPFQKQWKTKKNTPDWEWLLSRKYISSEYAVYTKESKNHRKQTHSSSSLMEISDDEEEVDCVPLHPKNTMRSSASSSEPTNSSPITLQQWDMIYFMEELESKKESEREMDWFQQQPGIVSSRNPALNTSCWYNEVLDVFLWKESVSLSSMGYIGADVWYPMRAGITHFLCRTLLGSSASDHQYSLIISTEREIPSWMLFARKFLHPHISFVVITDDMLKGVQLHQIRLGAFQPDSLKKRIETFGKGTHQVFLISRMHLLKETTSSSSSPSFIQQSWTRVFVELDSVSLLPSSPISQRLALLPATTKRWVVGFRNQNVIDGLEYWLSILTVWGWDGNAVESFRMWIVSYSNSELCEKKETRLHTFVRTLMEKLCVQYASTLPFPCFAFDERKSHGPVLKGQPPQQVDKGMWFQSLNEIIHYNTLVSFYKQKYNEYLDQKKKEVKDYLTRSVASSRSILERKKGEEEGVQDSSRLKTHKRKLGETSVLTPYQICRVWICDVNCGTLQTISDLKSIQTEYNLVSKVYKITGSKVSADCYEEFTGTSFFNEQETNYENCSICYSDMQQPIVTKCGHFFCLQCMLAVCSSYVEQDNTLGKVYVCGIRCPLCRFSLIKDGERLKNAKTFLFRPNLKQLTSIVEKSEPDSEFATEMKELLQRVQGAASGVVSNSSSPSEKKVIQKEKVNSAQIVFRSKLSFVMTQLLQPCSDPIKKQNPITLVLSSFEPILIDLSLRLSRSRKKQSFCFAEDLRKEKTIQDVESGRVDIILWSTYYEFPTGLAPIVDQVILMEPSYNVETWCYWRHLFHSFVDRVPPVSLVQLFYSDTLEQNMVQEFKRSEQAPKEKDLQNFVRPLSFRSLKVEEETYQDYLDNI